MNGKRKYGFSGIFLVVLMLLLLYYLFAGMRSSGDISYAQLRQLFQQEQVQSFVIRDTRITADLKDGTTATCDLYSFDLFYDDLNELVEQQSASGIITDYNYHADHSTNWLQLLLPYVLAILAFILLMNLMARNAGGGMDSKMARFGEARVQTPGEGDKKTTFRDVAGADEEKEELREIVDFLNARARENQWGFVDFNRPMVAINQWEQAEDSMYTLCGKDRIHPSTDGHLVMAYLFLKAQGLAGKPVADIRIDGAGKKVTRSDNCRVSDLSVSSDNLTFTYEAKSLPYPIDTSYYDNEKHTQADALSVIPFMDEMNYEGLSVSGLSDGYYGLTIGREFIGRFTARELERGINMALLQNTPQYKQAMKIRQMNEERWLKERKMREFYWVEYNLMRKTGMLWACDEAAVDTLRKYRPHDIFLQWNGDLWLQYMHKGIREDCVNEQQDLVNRIYEQNKPIPLRIEIKKFTDL